MWGPEGERSLSKTVEVEDPVYSGYDNDEYADEPAAPAALTVSQRPVISDRRAAVVAQDPFAALMEVLNKYGKPEAVEIKIAGLGAIKFRALALQIRSPLVAMMVDLSSLSVDLEPHTTMSLTLRQRVYSKASFIATLAFGGDVGIMLFVVDDDSEQGDAKS